MELWKITGVANDSVAHELHNICHHSAESSTLLYKNSQRISEVLKDQFLASGLLLLTEPRMPLCTGQGEYIINTFLLWNYHFDFN